MDVKSAFLYGTKDEEVYVIQPLGFHDLVYPAKVYKAQNGVVCPGEWLWEECVVVGCQENGEKKEENGAICLGGKHCALHSVLKSGTTGMVVLLGDFSHLFLGVKKD
nr:retrovirus-related Pol polyprotein from transposon TNT 1-94 [Tanacetum cinerariifolium]